MGRSGKLRASNDGLIREFIQDSNYKIENDGSIWSKISRYGYVTREWRPVALKPKKKGTVSYYFLRYRGKQLSIHRIVYQKFIGRLFDDLTINHIDGNGLNNSPTNLELVTQSKNNLHSFRVLGRPLSKGNRKLSDAQVLEIRRLHSTGIGYGKIAKQMGLTKSTVGYAVKRKTFKNL